MDSYYQEAFYSLAREHANIEYKTDWLPKNEYWRKKEELEAKMKDMKERYIAILDSTNDQ